MLEKLYKHSEKKEDNKQTNLNSIQHKARVKHLKQTARAHCNKKNEREKKKKLKTSQQQKDEHTFGVREEEKCNTKIINGKSETNKCKEAKKRKQT